jgi:hypothetical protein
MAGPVCDASLTFPSPARRTRIEIKGAKLKLINKDSHILKRLIFQGKIRYVVFFIEYYTSYCILFILTRVDYRMRIIVVEDFVAPAMRALKGSRSELWDISGIHGADRCRLAKLQESFYLQNQNDCKAFRKFQRHV